MRKLNIPDNELKDLLKSASNEEPSSNFTSKLMVKVQEAAQKEDLRTAYIKQLSRKIAAVVSGVFIVNLVLLISAFLQGSFNDVYRKLVPQLANHFFIQVITNPVTITAILSLAFAVWCIVYMQRNTYKNAS